MVWSLLVLVGGLVLLARSADQLVVAAARLAGMLRVAPVIIGAVVIGFGTSAPELVISGLAAAEGDADLGIGNVLGSDIANLALVLPVAALAGTIAVSSTTLRREVPISAASCLAFVVLVRDGLSRADGVVLVLLLAVAITAIVRRGRRPEDLELALEVEEYLATATRPRARESLRAALGLVGTVVGAQLVVVGARDLAEAVGLSEGFIGLSLVAVGTSLPELVTAVQAVRRGEEELIVGNLLGSNLFNNLAVGGVIGLIGAGPLEDPHLVRWGSLVLLVVVAASWVAMWHRGRVHRWEAVGLLALYVVAVPLLA